MTEKTVTVNYTDEQEAKMREAYLADPSRATVDKLAVEMGKTARSIIAKLANLKVYVKPVYKTKAGEPVAKKDDTADAIGIVLKLSANDIDSLTKANKTALATIWKALSASTPIDGPDERAKAIEDSYHRGYSEGWDEAIATVQ